MPPCLTPFASTSDKQGRKMPNCSSNLARPWQGKQKTGDLISPDFAKGLAPCWPLQSGDSLSWLSAMKAVDADRLGS